MNQRQQLIEQIRQQSVQARAQALREAAKNQANNSPIAAAAGAASGGGRVQRGCTERDGLTMTWQFTDGKDQPRLIIQRVFLPYTGLDTLGNATFGLVAQRFVFGTETDLFSLLVRKSGDQWLLEELTTGSRGSGIRVIAQSADLYEGWIGLTDENGDFEQTLENITATCGDQTYRRLCITSQSEAPFGTFTYIVGGVEAIIPEISEEYPAGYGGSRPDLFWETKDSRWSIGGTIIEDADDISQPPTGQFSIEGGVVTIVEGQCTGEVPPQPEPILVTTTDIQVGAETKWKWLTPFISGNIQYGSIGSFQIDGQQGVIESSTLPGENSAFQINQLITPNTYTITLTPNSTALLTLGGQAVFSGSYTIVNMILTITTNGDSPINTESGQIANISGTITYEESNNAPKPPK